MNKRTKAFWLISTVAVALAAVLGVWAYLDFYGGPAHLDREFYEIEQPFSYEPYGQALQMYVDENGMVDYAGLKANREPLDRFVRGLAAVDRATYASWDDNTKIAFWINAYNALTLKVIIDHYPIESGVLVSRVFPANSIRQIPRVWERFEFLVAERTVNLNQIEHDILRADFDEPRIHVALVCAAMGCPRLRNEVYQAAALDRQLDDQARGFLADPKTFRIDRTTNTVYLSSILDWFKDDFVTRYGPADGFGSFEQSDRSILNFSANHLSTPDADYLRKGGFKLEYLDYDWTLNEQKQ